MNAALIPSALAHRGYTWVFAAGYASFNVLGFYPGILYSDSVARWGMAIEIANHGLSVLSLHTNHHPVLAAIALSVFYRLTGELGVFVFCQSFAFALSLFVFVGVFRRGAIGNVLVSVVLMAPINRVYSIFHSYDSIAAIALILSCASTLRLVAGDTRQRCFLPPLFGLLAVFRLNAIAMLLPAAAAVAAVARRQGLSRAATGAYLTGLGSLIAVPLWMQTAMPMRPHHTWVMGFAWEYVNLAAKSKDGEALRHLARSGVDIERAHREGCYHSIYCDEQGHRLGKRLVEDPSGSRDLLMRYAALALRRPVLFCVEKAKYIASQLGITRPLDNSEIGRWRYDPSWIEHFANLGFRATPAQERFIDRYFSFSQRFEDVFFRPYLAFAAACIVAGLVFIARGRDPAIAISIPILFSIAYYATFAITVAGHELRYFFPSLFVIQGVCAVAASELLGGFYERCRSRRGA